MKNAKISILSLWKATKERLSGIVTKRLKEREKNLQSIVKVKKSLSSRPTKETSKNIDAEIFEDLEKITFKFGDETLTIGEARLLFAYEIKLDLHQVYVIALSEKYGTIVFYLPKELTEKITNRTAQLSISFSNYLYSLIELHAKGMELTYKMAKCGYTVAEAVEALRAMCTITATPIDKRIRSNNWLKLHGQPMRRKKGKRKNE